MEKTTEIDNVLRANINRLLDSRKETQKAIAAAVGINENYLSKVRSGKVRFSPELIAAFAKYMGVPELSMYRDDLGQTLDSEEERQRAFLLKMSALNQEMADAGRHMTKMANEIEALKAELEGWKRFAVIPMEILEKLARVNWRTKGVISVLKLAIRPHLKKVAPSHAGSPSQTLRGKLKAN